MASAGEGPAAAADDTAAVFTIAVAGGTGSGKTTLCDDLQARVSARGAHGQASARRVLILHETWFYKDVPEGVSVLEHNFDHPSALDEDLMVSTLESLKRREPVRLSPYDDMQALTRRAEPVTLEPCDVVILEGILVLYSPRVRSLLDLKLFVDMDSDTRLARRVTRDVKLGRNLDAILEQYVTMVKPCFETWAEPTKKFADLVVPRGSENTVAIDLVFEHICSLLDGKDGKRAPGEGEGAPASVARSGGVPH